MIVRLVAYVALVPSLVAISIDEYNGQRVRQAGIWGLVAVYYAVALGSVTAQILGTGWDELFRAMLTPVLLLQAFLALWILIQPSKGQ